jgi:hypothetical protein
MESALVPGIYYDDVSRDITEHDLDVVSDLWTIDGREVYRGSRDPRYTHATVYWLYSEDLERVGLSEHSLSDQADFRVLWFQDTDFGTFLQEDGWEKGEDIWSRLPRHVFDRFVNEGWTTPLKFLEQCLSGETRIFTPEMVKSRPEVWVCRACGKRTLTPVAGCTMVAEPLDFPTTEKVFFIDEDMIVYRPPPTSRIWDLLRPPQPSRDGSSEPVSQEQEREVPQQEPTPPPARPLEPPPEERPAAEQSAEALQTPPQSRP